jgi:hypothetical protein
MTWRSPSQETPELDGDLQPGDLINGLRELKFDGTEFRAVRIDRDVRDYLVNTLSTRHAARRA